MIDWQALAHPGPANDILAPRARNMVVGPHSRRDLFAYLANSHDRWDYVHFRDRGLGRGSDVWDNRRKVVA